LLYVGIAPRGPGGTRSLAERLSRDHHGGNIGGSTLRFSLAGLLRGHLPLTPKPGHDRARIVEESTLTQWIDENLGVNVVPTAKPWEIEEAVIRSLNPPLNIRPGFHPFRCIVSEARTQLAAACKALP
jgi:hypothetical protein